MSKYPATGSVVRQLGSLFECGSAAGLSDRQLLERFTAQRDAAGEAAFAALVARHGPMVLDVCRQLLGDRHHAEDAFQAVFLVLARRAGAIRDPELLGHWLYGVALRTARCTRSQLARRRRKEEGDAMRHSGPGLSTAVEPMVPPADRPAIDREQAEALHVEIERLPRSFRLAVILCYFEGLTLDEAARRLRCPPGTVGSRLARAREKLRRGLTRRGVTLPAATLAAALAPRSASASIPSPLCDITTRAAIRFAAGQAAAGASASATALTRKVLRSMLLHKLEITMLTLMCLGAVVTGVGYLTHALAIDDQPGKAFDGPQPRLATKPDLATDPGRMIATGRVLDPAGKPVRGALVEVIGRPRKPWVGTDESMNRHALLGRGSTGHDGRFRFDASRTSSVGFFEVHALSVAPGFGIGWASLNPDADQPTVEVRLQAEQVIQGRLVDISGQQAAAVEIRVAYVRHRYTSGPIDGLLFWDGPPEGLRTWPGPVKSDDQGRFTLAGIGRGCEVHLGVHDPRFASLSLHLPADDREGPREVTLALQP
ncbi:MAG: sigma-70 family RNA polymerase sigma factor [Isosphaeraceae bacterium]